MQLAASLRDRLQSGEWSSGDRLPTEASLTQEYAVSRSTVRAALQLLEHQGLTKTRHGVGTFVTPFGPAIKAGLQELRSMSDTIRAHGMEPEMAYHSAALRSATADDAEQLGLPAGAMVLATERAVLADGQTVAFSYERIPATLLPAGFDPTTVSGSLFRLLETAGVHATTAVADIHAARGREIGWGERPRGAAYLLLSQVHYDADATAVMSSRTYFLEGRFQFSVLRVR